MDGRYTPNSQPANQFNQSYYQDMYSLQYMFNYPPFYNPSFVPDERRSDSTISNQSTASSTASSTGKDSPATNEQPKRKYDTWTQQQQKLLVRLWAENHEFLESKESRNAWRKICDELNKREKINKTVEKCKKKISYLLDRYKIAKEWNKKQTGGNKRKSPFYDEIDAVLGCRDVVTMSKVLEAGTSSSTINSDDDHDHDNNESQPAKKEEKVEERKAKRKGRKAKKRRVSESDDEDKEQEKISESLKSFKESSQKLNNFMDTFSEAQKKQTEMMGQFLGALTQFMANQAPKSSQ